jgi:hypothetical protein
VTPGDRVAAQLDSSTLLPAPADPTTTVRRRPAPALSPSSSRDRATRAVGSVVGLNLAGANRAVREVPRGVAVACVTFHPQLRRPGQPALSRSHLLSDMVRHGLPPQTT